MYVGENETSKYWLMVLNDLRNRGFENVLIFSIDNLPEFSEAVYNNKRISTTRYTNQKDRKELVNDLKIIYKTVSSGTTILISGVKNIQIVQLAGEIIGMKYQYFSYIHNR